MNVAHISSSRRSRVRSRTSAALSRASSERGLTLVEIIVVLVILSILIGFLTGGLFSSGERAKMQINQLRMTRVKNAINQYQLMYNLLPNDLNALVTCSEATGTGCVPVAEADTLKDVWGTPFVYRSESGGRSYTLKSLGSDRKEGGSDSDADMVLTGP